MSVIERARQELRRRGFEGAELERLVSESREQEIQRRVSAEQRAQSSGLLRAGAGSLGAFGVNLADSATLGVAPKLLGEDVELGVEVAQRTNPIASTAGRVGGFFGKLSPAGIVSRTAAGAVTRATGAKKLTQLAADRGFLARSGTQFANNLLGGSGAIGAVTLLEQRSEDSNLGARISDIAEASSSPLSLGISAGTALVSAKLGGSVDRDIRRLALEFEKRTGERLPADVLTDNKTLQGFFNMAAQVPGLAGPIKKVQDGLFRGLRESVSGMARRRRLPASRGASRGRAAAEARRLQGTREGPGAITEARRGPQTLALAAEGNREISRVAQNNLVSGLARVLKDNPGRETRAGFKPIIQDVLRLARSAKQDGRRLTLAELEGLRKQTGRLAYAGKGVDPLDPRLAGRSQVDARRFYQEIDEAISSTSPRYHRTLQEGEKFRRLEEALNPEAVRQLDDVTAQQFWSAKNVVGRIEAMEKQGDPVESQMLKGWLFHKLIEKVADPQTGLVNEKRLRTATNASSGMFNSQVLDRVLPGVRRELMDLANISTRATRGIASAPNSATFARGVFGTATLGIPAAVVGVITALAYNPFSAMTTLLGTAGLTVAWRAALKSGISGAGKQALENAVVGAPQPLSRLPAALSDAQNTTIDPLGRSPQPLSEQPIPAIGRPQ